MKTFFNKLGAGICSIAPTFLKGFVVGLGAMAPGLSGSILLIIFGLYQKIVYTVSNIFKDFKKNLAFLMPLIIGVGLGIITFAKVISAPLEAFPFQTNYAFLGLVLGTLPMLWSEVKKEGYKTRHYFFSLGAFIIGGTFFILSYGLFPDILKPTFLQAVILGFAVACAYLIPGVDSAVILSSFGLYNLWLGAFSDIGTDSILHVLLPAALGLAVGGIIISLIFNKLLSKCYTGTYSIVFGLFIAVILNFIVKECIPTEFNLSTVIAFLLLILGFAFSVTFSHIEEIVGYFKNKKTTKGEF